MGASGADLPGFGSSLLLSLLSLGLVCVVAFLVLRWLGRRTGTRADDLVRVLGRCYLVGVGDGAPSLLAEIDQASLPPDRLVTAGGSTWGELLGKLSRKGKP
jgi:hypothetical protein